VKLLLGLLVVVALSGCGFGAGESKKGGVELRVTRDFGQRDQHSDAAKEDIRESDTVMRFLQQGHKVTTRFGGGFVQSIDGLAGDQAAEDDWFYYVNGREASVGAADYKLAAGDVVQWDYHDWHATQHVPAIVGAFPQPFAHGLTGKRLPTRLECEDDQSKACGLVGDTLAKYGVHATSAAIGSPVSDKSLRVIVAKFSVARQVLAAKALTKGPATTGVYAKFDPAGTALSLLDAGGRVARAAAPGTGLIAATQQAEQPVTWLVTGVDEGGVQRAAGALSPAALRNAFAVAVTPSGPVKLPLGASR
jgi:Domain of unknown function (DUF4430)